MYGVLWNKDSTPCCETNQKPMATVLTRQCMQLCAKLRVFAGPYNSPGWRSPPLHHRAGAPQRTAGPTPRRALRTTPVMEILSRGISSPLSLYHATHKKTCLQSTRKHKDAAYVHINFIRCSAICPAQDNSRNTGLPTDGDDGAAGTPSLVCGACTIFFVLAHEI